jgi:hypothetical protein
LSKPRPTFRKPRETPLSPDAAALIIQNHYRDYRLQQDLKASCALEDLLSDPKNGKKVTSLDEIVAGTVLVNLRSDHIYIIHVTYAGRRYQQTSGKTELVSLHGVIFELSTYGWQGSNEEYTPGGTTMRYYRYSKELKQKVLQTDMVMGFRTKEDAQFLLLSCKSGVEQGYLYKLYVEGKDVIHGYRKAQNKLSAQAQSLSVKKDARAAVAYGKHNNCATVTYEIAQFALTHRDARMKKAKL